MNNITIIAAIGENFELGLNNKLIWNIPKDLKFFKENTQNKPIVMGINTLKSLPKKLPNRKYIVLTHREIKLDDDIQIFHNLEDLLEFIKTLDNEVMIIGGASIYRQFIDYADKMLLTEIQSSSLADTYFPKFNMEEWDGSILEEHQYQDIKYRHVEYTRKKSKKINRKEL